MSDNSDNFPLTKKSEKQKYGIKLVFLISLSLVYIWLNILSCIFDCNGAEAFWTDRIILRIQVVQHFKIMFWN